MSSWNALEPLLGGGVRKRRYLALSGHDDSAALHRSWASISDIGLCQIWISLHSTGKDEEGSKKTGAHNLELAGGVIL